MASPVNLAGRTPNTHHRASYGISARNKIGRHPHYGLKGCSQYCPEQPAVNEEPAWHEGESRAKQNQ
eukprot:1161096-Pelagomonas_calceolata.AAC.2